MRKTAGMLAVLLLLAAAGPLAGAEPSASVEYVKGEAQLYNPGAGWQKAKPGDVVKQKSVVRTLAEGEVHLRTDRGDVIRVFPRTVLEFQNFEVAEDYTRHTRLKLGGRGRVRCTVEKLQSFGDSFRVATPTMVAGVRGTDFGVEAPGQGESSVKAFEGRLEVRSPEGEGKSVMLFPGEMLTAGKGAPLGRPRKMTHREFEEYGAGDLYDKAVKQAKGREEKTPTRAPVEEPSEATEAAEVPAEGEAAEVPPTGEEPEEGEMPGEEGEAEEEEEEAEEETEKAPREPWKFGFVPAIKVGPTVIDDVTWTWLLLRPEFSFGPIGLGLYLSFVLDLNVGDGTTEEILNYRNWQNRDEWDFSYTWGEDLFMKILYISWGKKRDKPVYAKIGSIDDFTIGHGTIMNHYSNMVEFPVKRRAGLQFDLDFDYAGMETMVADLFRRDIWGARVYVRPLRIANLGMLESLALGATFVNDTEPVHNLDPVVYGVSLDADLPVFPLEGDPMDQGNAFSLLIFGDYIRMGLKEGEGAPYRLDNGSGILAGVMGRILIATYRVEFRHFRNGLQTEYFDVFYESKRARKAGGLLTAARIPNEEDQVLGWFAEAGFQIEVEKKIVSFALNFAEYYTDGGDFDSNRLHMELAMEKGIVPKVHGTFAYDRTDLKSGEIWTDKFQFCDDRTILSAALSYEIQEGVDVEVSIRRAFAYDETGKLVPVEQYAITPNFQF